MKSEWVAVFDVDGVFTDGSFYSSSEGKMLKKFGADDWDAVNELRSLCPIHVVTADRKGYPITQNRIEIEMGWLLDLVPNKPIEARWRWIKKSYPDKKIIYVGDGIHDWYCLHQADFSATPSNALRHVKQNADYISDRIGGDRFVADVCLYVMEHIFGVYSYAAWD